MGRTSFRFGCAYVQTANRHCSTHIHVSQVSYVGLRASGVFYLVAMGDADLKPLDCCWKRRSQAPRRGLAELCGMAAAMRSVPWTKGPWVEFTLRCGSHLQSCEVPWTKQRHESRYGGDWHWLPLSNCRHSTTGNCFFLINMWICCDGLVPGWASIANAM